MLLAVAVFGTGCGKSDPTKVDAAPVEKSFASAEPGLKATAQKAVEAIKKGDLATASTELQKLLAEAKLTDDQKKAVAALTERQHGLVLQLRDQRGNDTEEQFKTDLRTFRTEAVAQFVESLKPDQRATWKALLGEPVKSFDLYELWICAIQDDDWEPPVPSGPEPSALR